MLVIAPEREEDRAAVRLVEEQAFGRTEEADLVARLRTDGDVVVSLVAFDGASAVGHILFSRLAVTGVEPAPRAAALAPLAVRPHWQRRGIGAALVRSGIDQCRATGIAAVIVLGHPDYYPRFGFSAPLAEALVAPFSGNAFMALELEPGALARGGRIVYPRAFGIE